MQKIKFAFLVLLIVSAHSLLAQEVFMQDSIRVKLLPFKTSLQWVGDHPYDWNDGPMVPAKGWQQYLNAGVNLQWKNWELQLAPELVAAQNLAYTGFSESMDQVHWRDYYRFYNFIETPERMGQVQYNHLFLGQSFVKFTHHNTVFKLSSENKWWGPGFRNALILSNNAAGFPHVSIANQKPLASRLGTFNYELIWGQLINSGFPPPASYLTYFGEQLYAPKENRDRAFQAMHINYIPKWFPNLTLGVEQSFVQYTNQLKGIADYLPIKNIIYRLPNDVLNQPITLTAFYFNYAFPAVQAKIYGEFGWNLNRTSLRNWLVQPDKGFANVLGFSKIIPTNKAHYWEFKAEMANLQLLTVAEQFTTGAPPSWYLGSYVRQGYTNNGKIIGAGVGPGGTSQTLELNWRKGMNRIGISAERRLHNNDFYVYSFTPSGDFRRFYVDFATTLKVDWRLGQWDIGPRLSYIQTNNYNWELFQTNPDKYFVPGHDIQQVTSKLNLTYHF
ncbi:MAG: hypothetical protein RLZ56_1453 [Bacteroidota bacterium]|jgi:hypothetical protein